MRLECANPLVPLQGSASGYDETTNPFWPVLARLTVRPRKAGITSRFTFFSHETSHAFAFTIFAGAAIFALEFFTLVEEARKVKCSQGYTGEEDECPDDDRRY